MISWKIIPPTFGRIYATMESYRIPAREIRNEIKVVNSRFIATLAPVFEVNEAKVFIARIKAEYSDASHNVPAFVVWYGATIVAHCNDDGEPSGTAGRPALAVLQGSWLGDAAVVVTRYFGGTKLGKCGLVRAYGDAVRQVLKIAPQAEKVLTQTLIFALPYAYFERARLLIEGHHGEIMDEEFAADITMTCRFKIDDSPHFEKALTELSHGVIKAIILEDKEVTIMPIRKTK